MVMKCYVGARCCYGIADCVTVKWKPECMFIYLFIPWILIKSKKPLGYRILQYHVYVHADLKKKGLCLIYIKC